MRQLLKSRSCVFELKARVPWTCRNLENLTIKKWMICTIWTMLHKCGYLNVMHGVSSCATLIALSFLKFSSALTRQKSAH